MQFTPRQAAAHLKESIASYIESQYRISHPMVFAERAALLREHGVIAQDPFIEATPAFVPGPVVAGIGAGVSGQHTSGPLQAGRARRSR